LTYTSIKELNPDRCTFSPKIQFHQSVFYWPCHVTWRLLHR
jgi:hypothetical protein